MGVLDLVRGRNDTRTVQDVVAVAESVEERGETEKQEVVTHPVQPTSSAAIGVQKAEAAALVWSKTAVRATYAWIWVCFFMLALQAAIGNNVIYHAYSAFSTAPEVATASILANIVGGVLKLPIAKTLNLWGRAEGFLVFVGIYILGIIVIASCSGPHGYAAGYTLYWVGYDAIYFIMDVFIADTSGLRNRAFALAFASTPFVCTAFTGPLAAQSFLAMTSWRWAYGAFAIIMPVVFVPLAVVFKYYTIKANKMGLFIPPSSRRTTLQSMLHYLHEFDVVGSVLLMAAFVLFLLPFSLQTYGRSTYNSATFVAMVIMGILLFFVFAAWERFGARAHFIRWELFKKPTVLGACLLSAVLFFSFFAWDQYFYYFVQVVYDLSISNTGYMTQIYNVGSCFWSVVFGVWVRQTRHFKWTCLFFGLPLLGLGAGLMVHFRGTQGQSIGYIIMCQIFIAFGGATLTIGEDMAVMAASDRDGVPMMLAVISLCSSLGGAIGNAVAAAVYTNTFPKALLEALPAGAKGNFTVIYTGGSTTQMLYPPGSPTRNAIDYAWSYSQKCNSIAATAILVLAIPAVLLWKNYNVDRKQNKGVLI
ncbi:hypothetical protein P8C59_003661 [Phyllachora maydis]|uniref:Siderochrome-iron transporter n=1 Tax=Phyllachora maydis TaxID=1825666 RepID=A0AAD9I1V4_9PEZI|nr:hypothetical protein P8C59_003661 [Phyllachora maydis]